MSELKDILIEKWLPIFAQLLPYLPTKQLTDEICVLCLDYA